MLAEIGDEVLFHGHGGWIKAEVVDVRNADTVTVIHEQGSTVAQHGAHIEGWLTYAEAAQYARDHSSA
jgi:delta-aminolevulinic acid dehydratase/porphobilinogen synthase